jgi:hypothetical protein
MIRSGPQGAHSMCSPNCYYSEVEFFNCLADGSRDDKPRRVSRNHRGKLRGKLMPERTAKSNAARWKVCAHVERVFARQQELMCLFNRTIGITRAGAKITPVNLPCKMHGLIF